MHAVIQELDKEHEYVSDTMLTLEKLLQEREFQKTFDELYNIILEFNTFISSEHHAKEEQIIYDWILKQNRNADVMLINKMIDDHRHFEKEILKVKSNIESYRMNPKSVSPTNIGYDLSFLVTRYKEHLERETTFIFVIADHLFQKESLKAV